MRKIMAIILNYNSIENCKTCVTYLKKQIGVQLLITIVDNASDDSKIELKQICDNMDVCFIASEENRGFSAGNNIGLRKATECCCDYALIINPDVELRDENYISKAIEVMGSKPEVAVLGTDIINIEGKHQNPMREVSYLAELFWPLEMVRKKFTRKNPYVCDSNKSGYCYKLSGCCFFVRMEFIEKIGYLDENVFLYCEEPILAARVQREGKKEYYLSELLAYHMHNESEKGNQLKRLNEFYKSRTYYLKYYSGYSGIKLKLLLLSRKFQNKMYRKKFARNPEIKSKKLTNQKADF